MKLTVAFGARRFIGESKGPIQRDSLSDEQLERIDAIRNILVEVDKHSREDWIDSFKRELDPD